MSDLLISVSVPYVLEYVRRRCSKVEGGVFWEDGTVVIRSLTAKEAPVAFRVRAEGRAFPAEYSVRSFDGRLWWPLFDGTQPLSNKDYIAGASRSDGLFLAMMNLSPATVGSPRRDANQFYAREVDTPQREERWDSARKNSPPHDVL